MENNEECTVVSIIYGTCATICTEVTVARCNSSDRTSISWESVNRFSRSWMELLILYVFFIRSRICGLMRFHDRSYKGTESHFVQISGIVRQRPWKLLDKRSGKKAWAVHGKSKLIETEKARHVKSNVKSMLIIFRDVKEIFHKEFVPADQTGNSA
jgi:hypothetical protein